MSGCKLRRHRRRKVVKREAQHARQVAVVIAFFSSSVRVRASRLELLRLFMDAIFWTIVLLWAGIIGIVGEC
jgi:hypothetical protein